MTLLNRSDSYTARRAALVADVNGVLESLRPAMQADGGDVKVVDVHEGTVEIRLVGACTCCPSASLTLKRGIEPALKSRLPWVQEVICVRSAGQP